MEDRELQNFILLKLRDIEERQIIHLEKITEISGTLENGLKKKVDVLCIDFKNICKGFEDRLAVLEEFSWFRNLVTTFRDKSLRYGLGGFLILVMAVIAAHIGDAVLSKALAAVMKIWRG